jgi:hypothetical protein
MNFEVNCDKTKVRVEEVAGSLGLVGQSVEFVEGEWFEVNQMDAFAEITCGLYNGLLDKSVHKIGSHIDSRLKSVINHNFQSCFLIFFHFQVPNPKPLPLYPA